MALLMLAMGGAFWLLWWFRRRLQSLAEFEAEGVLILIQYTAQPYRSLRRNICNNSAQTATVFCLLRWPDPPDTLASYSIPRKPP